ncbi:MAG: hypothetical protein ABUT39_04830 [Acidobacteriota bacterium]
MSREKGGSSPACSTGGKEELSASAKPEKGGAGRVEVEWKQQREKPVAGGFPQALVRLPQQSPQETAPARTGQRMPRITSPRKSHAGRPRLMVTFIAQGFCKWLSVAQPRKRRAPDRTEPGPGWHVAAKTG